MKMFTIHNVDSNWNKKYEENKVNNEDILTLDDGLYSQYKYLDKMVNNIEDADKLYIGQEIKLPWIFWGIMYNDVSTFKNYKRGKTNGWYHIR